MPGMKHAIAGFGLCVRMASILTFLHSLRKIFGILPQAKNKDFFFPLQYELLCRIGIHKFHFTVMLEADKDKVMTEKSKLDSPVYPTLQMSIALENEIGRVKARKLLAIDS